MARTDLTPITIPTRWSTTPVALTWTAADVSNGNQFTLSGDEIVLVHNNDVGAQTITVTSSPDPYGRSADIDAVSIPAGEYRVLQRFPVDGWQQSDGKLYIDASDADVRFAVIKLPSGSA